MKERTQPMMQRVRVLKMAPTKVKQYIAKPNFREEYMSSPSSTLLKVLNKQEDTQPKKNIQAQRHVCLKELFQNSKCLFLSCTCFAVLKYNGIQFSSKISWFFCILWKKIKHEVCIKKTSHKKTKTFPLNLHDLPGTRVICLNAGLDEGGEMLAVLGDGEVHQGQLDQGVLKQRL